MTFTHISSRRDGAVERLTLNRPDVRNAFDDTTIAELTAWADACAADATLRAVVIAGAGPTFSAGADLTWMARTADYSEADNLADARRASTMFAAIDRLPVPVIARIHGAALGGGTGLAAVSDVVVAERGATFGFTEVKLGIIPAVIAPFILAKIGRSAARELFLTGRRFTAEHATEIGLVHAVVPAEDLDAAVDAVLRDVLAAGREAIAAAKQLIAQVSAAESFDDLQALTAEALAKRRVSDEGQEGLRAFLEKRRPRWSQS